MGYELCPCRVDKEMTMIMTMTMTMMMMMMKMSFALFVTTPYNLQIPYVQTQKVLEIGQVFRPLLLAAFNSGVGHPFHDSKNKAEQKKRNARSYCNFPRLARNPMKNNENIYLILVARSQLFSCSSP